MSLAWAHTRSACSRTTSCAQRRTRQLTPAPAAGILGYRYGSGYPGRQAEAMALGLILRLFIVYSP
jgi:hypothetical protein